MNTTIRYGVIATIGALCTSLTLAQELPTNGSMNSRVGKLTFESGYPSQETVTKLYDEMDFQRACQAYIWGIPAVGLEEWQLAHRDILRGKTARCCRTSTLRKSSAS